MQIDAHGNADRANVWLFHGSAAPPESLDSLVDALAVRHHVLVPHFPGYGDTRYGQDDGLATSLNHIARLIHEDGRQVMLVGHSFGAYRASRLLGLLSPGIVAGCYGLGAISTLGEQWREGFEAAEAWARIGQDIPEGLAARWFSPAFLSARPNLIEQIERWWSRCHIEAVVRELYEPFDGGQADRIIAASTVPMKFRVGQLDVAAPPELTHAIASLRQGIEVEVVANMGHFLHMEDAENTLASLEAFIDAYLPNAQ